MPKRIAEDHKQFRDIVAKGILTEYGKAQLKKALASGTIFRGRQPGKSVSITIPHMAVPNFVFNDETPPKKRKKYRSIEEPWEPSW